MTASSERHTAVYKPVHNPFSDAKNPTWVIYGLRLDSDFEYRYVGQTRQKIKTRVGVHRHYANTGRRDSAVYHWIRKHGAENIHCDILELCPEYDHKYLDDAEMYWIALVRSYGHRLLNHNEGGSGNRGYRHTEETLSRSMNNRLTGRRWTEDRRLAYSASYNGENAPWYGRKGEDVPWYGTTYSDDRRKAMSLGAKFGKHGSRPESHVAYGIVNMRCGECRKLYTNGDVTRYSTPSEIKEAKALYLNSTPYSGRIVG